MSSKNILITGVSSGIGYTTALNLAKQGYQVFAGVRKESDLESLNSLQIPNLIPIILDVLNDTHIEKAFEIIQKNTDDGSLFGLINNAGMNYVNPFELADESDIRQVMDVNLFSPIKITQKFLILLQQYKQNTGKNSHIINVGSVGSVIGLPWEYIYHVSKFAIYGFSKSIRLEVEPLGIKVSCVMPGAIITNIFDKTQDGIIESQMKLKGQNKNYYNKALETMKKSANLLKNQGSKPEKVANVISSILRKENPRVKNLVGMDAKFLNFVELYLPEWAFNSLIRALMIPKN